MGRSDETKQHLSALHRKGVEHLRAYLDRMLIEFDGDVARIALALETQRTFVWRYIRRAGLTHRPVELQKALKARFRLPSLKELEKIRAERRDNGKAR